MPDYEDYFGANDYYYDDENDRMDDYIDNCCGNDLYDDDSGFSSYDEDPDFRFPEPEDYGLDDSFGSLDDLY